MFSFHIISNWSKIQIIIPYIPLKSSLKFHFSAFKFDCIHPRSHATVSTPTRQLFAVRILFFFPFQGNSSSLWFIFNIKCVLRFMIIILHAAFVCAKKRKKSFIKFSRLFPLKNLIPKLLNAAKAEKKYSAKYVKKRQKAKKKETRKRVLKRLRKWPR